MGKGRFNWGFTLLEVAIAILVVSLLLGGLLGPLSVRVEQQERARTQALLEEIREALLGYAAMYGILPCPTTEQNPASTNYGVADATCPAGGATTDGYLPWKTLGVSLTDAWGKASSCLGRSLERSLAVPRRSKFHRYSVHLDDTAQHDRTTCGRGSRRQQADDGGGTSDRDCLVNRRKRCRRTKCGLRRQVRSWAIRPDF